MKKNGFWAGVLTTLVIMATITGVSARNGTVTQTVQYNNIGVILNGERLNLVDANGNSVEPFMYNSTNYLPVRAIAEALGLSVEWSNDQNAIVLSSDVKSKVKANVVRTIDGDTIVVNLDGKEETIRLIGVDTPESVHPTSSKNTEAGVAASVFTKMYLTANNSEVELEFDEQEKDKYGRTLAYVYKDGEMFNEKLLRSGYANVATYPPNTKYVARFEEIVKNRDSSLSSLKFESGCMEAPDMIFDGDADHNGLQYAILYADGTVKERMQYTNQGDSNSEAYKYIELETDQGIIDIMDTGSFSAISIDTDNLDTSYDNLKVGDTARIAFLYYGYYESWGRPEGFYVATLKKSSPEPEETPEPTSRTVYITRTGKRYHFDGNCNGGNYIKSTLNEAKSKGLTPCNKCAK